MKKPSKNNAEAEKRYWLIKSEEDCYSIDDLKRDGTTPWAGVRNFQARNFMRDDMSPGDLALFYHSSSSIIGVVGVAKVASRPYGDRTALDPKDEHFDPRSAKLFKEARDGGKEFTPVWMLVDFAFVRKLPVPITLSVIKNDPRLDGIMVAQAGSRLSIQPVSEAHFRYIVDVLGKK